VTESFGITPELLALIRKEEGWRSKPYLCPAGKPTIGYGHRIPTLDHPEITLAQGEAWLMEDVRRKRWNALSLSPGLANEPAPRLAAIIDFCFNVGEGEYATSHLRKRVNESKWAAAAAEMRQWVYYDADPGPKRDMEKLAGLVSRRAITAGWLERP
jgi:lysozyme